MVTRNLSLRLRWVGVIAIGLLCTAVAPAAAQQASSSAPLAAQLTSAAAPAAQAGAVEANAALPGPRVSPPTFQHVDPIVPRSNAQASSPARTTENHTVVVSTLAIVLIAIIVVLLLVR